MLTKRHGLQCFIEISNWVKLVECYFWSSSFESLYTTLFAMRCKISLLSFLLIPIVKRDEMCCQSAASHMMTGILPSQPVSSLKRNVTKYFPRVLLEHIIVKQNIRVLHISDIGLLCGTKWRFVMVIYEDNPKSYRLGTNLLLWRTITNQTHNGVFTFQPHTSLL